MSRWHLFDATGIEIEYMIVDRESLAVRPLTDRVLAAANSGQLASEVERGTLAWSNELVLHVIELKTNGPVTAIDLEVLRSFNRGVREIESLLAPLEARLLPTAMHPLMDPSSETVLWPHDYRSVYKTYDRIFDCRGHGWSNLQSLHLNFPFSGDHEFGFLHAAIRLVLPLLPALCASSPIVEGRVTGILDNRLEFYRSNSRRIPTVAGDIIPEAAFDRATYQRDIFAPMMRDIAPHDPDGVLEEEFLNSRGAIARFERGSIEVRVIDVQECPLADLAIATLTRAVLMLLVDGRLSDPADHREQPTAMLSELLRATTRWGADHNIDDASYLRLFGVEAAELTAGQLWRHLIERSVAAGLLTEPWTSTLDDMTRLGPLASRVRSVLDPQPTTAAILEIYRQLAQCLRESRLFIP